jgi:putative hydrolase of the HAD superfamily
MTITTLGLDADDTLWHSENHFAVTEQRFGELVAPWVEGEEAASLLLERERANLRLFGYGVKGFTLSMIETAIEVSGGRLPTGAVQRIIGWGKEMMDHPVELLAGVEETIEALGERYRLLLITKGDLFHQESKIAESGLAPHFEAIEILSEKSPDHYRRVLGRLGVDPCGFVMVGNSLRSDVLPVIDIGGHGVHIPYGITWGHEQVDGDPEVDTFHRLEEFAALPSLLDRLHGAGPADDRASLGDADRLVGGEGP